VIPVAYSSSDEHLWDELRRIDLLVRAQTLRWRLTVGASKPDHLWGMVHVTDAEVDAFLSTPFLPLDGLPSEIERAAAPLWAEAEARRAWIEDRLATTPAEIPLTLRKLGDAFDLSRVERDVLLLCMLPELDARYRRLYGYLQDDVSQTSPTAELLLQILHPVAPGAAGRAELEGGPLIANSLVVVPDERQDPRSVAVRPVRLDDRILAFLRGSVGLDRRLVGIVTQPSEPAHLERVGAEPEQVGSLQRLADILKRRDEPFPVVLFSGPYGSGRLTAARAVCTAAAIPVLIGSVDAALAAAEPFERVVDLCVREATLLEAALCWTGCETLLGDEQPPQHWNHVVMAAESFAGPTLFTSTQPWNPVARFRDRPYLRVDLQLPGYEQRRRLWDRCLPPADVLADDVTQRPLLVAALANAFQLTHGQMLDAVAAAHAFALQRDPTDPRPSADDHWKGCRAQSAHQANAFTRQIEPRPALTFADLVLPATNQRQLEELRDRLRHHRHVHSGLGYDRKFSLGNGVIAMFTGASGTGKTMAAEILASDQGVDLFKIDLSAVVSKYVGETEKNLSRVFDHAEFTNAMIFFDEADALFGKRAEVHEARDRWANIEVGHLLQRLEEFAGPVILASNLSQNIDDAFLRRVHIVVDFPFPEPPARLRIWQAIFPPGLARPSEDELAQIADRFPLAGRSIRNVALDATFRAMSAANGAAPIVTLRHVAFAVAREYQKLGKPLTRAEFGEELYEWIQELLRTVEPS
jgi:AAA+ superfamily predicted ATPase